MSMMTCLPSRQHAVDLAPEGPVQIPVDLGRLGEVAAGPPGEEFLAGQEVVVLAVSSRPGAAVRVVHDTE